MRKMSGGKKDGIFGEKMEYSINFTILVILILV